ncbi:MAG: hypothetical protein KGQ49_04220, partial [Verrucomicrobia bacterium]|nr:hypothetical protein [Verrucomicrobiota bacterium]
PLSEEEIVAAKPAEEPEEEQSAGYTFNRSAPTYYSNSFHRLCFVKILDHNSYALDLEDGSEWKVSTSDGIKASNWHTDDPLIITQNNRWFSSYEYRIINQANNTSVEAKLFLGPLLNGEYSRFIVSIDHTRGEIILNDYSHWNISYLDASLFKKWALNDYVIIGTNSDTSFWDSSSDSLLINVNMNHCVRAKQL